MNVAPSSPDNVRHVYPVYSRFPFRQCHLKFQADRTCMIHPSLLSTSGFSLHRFPDTPSYCESPRPGRCSQPNANRWDAGGNVIYFLPVFSFTSAGGMTRERQREGKLVEFINFRLAVGRPMCQLTAMVGRHLFNVLEARFFAPTPPMPACLPIQHEQ